ncbi:pyrroloquinoline quinone biosynthesis protein PqqF [Pseudomonas sp. NPDC090203]|uniref:pyrroloquinoline quinone biosynthesis protein PqqF n=1 Tax=Pseudomonas sp. NPDC090203 TaxID=3364477 RepID=UPI00381D51BA
MPAPDATTHRSLTLPNGLRVELCCAPRLKRSAAALRVAAGSHDVASQWPGLAHFLEHLFFLGTERFPADQKLMAYVQRHGGQLNASTRERTTDFFFELAPAAFAGGLARLCEMLAHPRMTLDDQLREREVLHAEFIAWSRDAASREQLKRLQPLSPLHPLRGFHAGNRFSLPVPRQAFQQALRDFYRTFYQAGQMTLSLAGPQPLDELEALARAHGGYFTKGSRVEQQMPPALLDGQREYKADTDQRQIHLMFPCEGLPEGHEQTAAFLCTWMNNTQPGGLVAQLRERGVIDSLKAQVVYEFAEQVLLEVEVALSDAVAGKRAPTENRAHPVGARLPATTPDQATQIQSLICHWLTFFKTHYHKLLGEHARLEQRRLAVSTALPLARHYSAQPTDLNDNAIDALLDQLTAQVNLPSTALGEINWRLPEANPFLRAPSTPISTAITLPAMTFSGALPTTGEGALYLRWTLPAPQPMLHRMLNASLKALSADAQQAGVTLAFTAYGNYWQLKLSGLAEPVPAVLEKALQLLSRPDEQTLARYGQPLTEPAPIPIRQLLATLADHFLNSTLTTETNDLQSVWASSRWIGFATGVGPALNHTLQQVPGNPDNAPIEPAGQIPGQRWRSEPSDSSENAVLLFYPTPSNSTEDEAIWRLFAHLVQAPFYQRLRVEMQLGYAVFSGFRQIAGQGGLLFGVQSPSADVEQLVGHIETFLQTLPELVAQADLPAELGTLAGQMDLGAMEIPAAAELLWQAHLCGHPQDYLERLQHSFAHLTPAMLRDAASRIALPQTARLCLANRPNPRV